MKRPGFRAGRRALRARPSLSRWMAGVLSGAATLLVLALLGFGLSLFVYEAPGPGTAGRPPTSVVLRKGAGVSEVAGRLASAGVIRSSALFIAAAELTRAAPHLRAGEYAFPPRLSLRAVLRIIRLGEIVHHRITIPEGLTSAQVVDVLNASPILTGPAPIPPEGAVLPETYEVARGEQRGAVLQRMMDERDRVVSGLWAHHRAGLPYATVEQAIILASIVEKETALPAERPRIAAVYVNRLRQGMKLQADPTVIYGVSGGAPLGRGLRQSELSAANPYNTYVVSGLPPGPIGNPGRASLAAAMDPPDTQDLYFVADGAGGHVFSTTYDEQARNVVRWRQIERRRQAESGAQTPRPRPPSARGR